MLNLIVDLVVISTLFWILGFVIYRFLPESKWNIFLPYVVAFGYYVIFEGLTGRTVGKLVTGTEVVNGEGGGLTLNQLVIRNLSRFIPFEPLSFLGPEPEGWHDILARSFVVKCR